jgi:hypothetical protein
VQGIAGGDFCRVEMLPDNTLGRACLFDLSNDCRLLGRDFFTNGADKVTRRRRHCELLTQQGKRLLFHRGHDFSLLGSEDFI